MTLSEVWTTKKTTPDSSVYLRGDVIKAGLRAARFV